MPDITTNTANTDGNRFSFSQITGGIPSKATKKEKRKRTTTD
jgi:hypothetical protein